MMVLDKDMETLISALSFVALVISLIGGEGVCFCVWFRLGWWNIHDWIVFSIVFLVFVFRVSILQFCAFQTILVRAPRIGCIINIVIAPSPVILAAIRAWPAVVSSDFLDTEVLGQSHANAIHTRPCCTFQAHGHVFKLIHLQFF